jgi:hypothetical protein
VAAAPTLLGTVEVTAEPIGAMVQLDDGTPTHAPARFEKLRAGSRHELLVAAPGFIPEKKAIAVEEGVFRYGFILLRKTAPQKPECNCPSGYLCVRGSCQVDASGAK